MFGDIHLFHTTESEFVVFAVNVTYETFINNCALTRQLLGRKYSKLFRIGYTWLGDMDDAKEAGTWSRVARTYFDQCQQCASSMGLTISSRCRLVVPKPPEDPAGDDPMTKMLRERAERRRKA